ncbi:hypothetical protein SAMN04489740_1072 [Arthrobacter alpinus]|uniref:Uncharacterized protein n=1 Tax=Arthrobacter alpinus TaxID=656366 RepID=A0A1H5HP76_9MICC|nr:hypothetical protein [Arthrobacter alpinus]SEE29787.1 hypothetical protein SAMN04489740_1072 [Arthrobacter alpinus]
MDQAIRSAGLNWADWPNVVADAPLTSEIRLSALQFILSAADRGTSSNIIDRVRRRRLPWSAETATLALRIVAEEQGFEGQLCLVALRGAEQVCLAGGATEELLASVRELRAVLGRRQSSLENLGPLDAWQLPETVAFIERVSAAATHPDLLDLSVVRDGDSWGPRAKEAASAYPASDVAAIVRSLTSRGPAKPSKKWLREVAVALESPGACELLGSWLKLAADADIVPPDDHASHGFAGAMLFAHGNDDVVRASVFAVQLLADEQWMSKVLGVIARRAAASSGVPGMTGALSLGVATAAVESLAVRNGAGDTVVLRELLEDLSRRDLIRRVGKHLGLAEEEISRRDNTVRLAKATAVRRRADPANREARSSLDALIRRYLAPILKQHGFTGQGRTFRREFTDRVDVIALGSVGLDQLRVEYGSRFATSWPSFNADVIVGSVLDIRISEYHGVSQPEIDTVALRLATHIIPFMDSMGRYELVAALAEHRAGVPEGAKLEIGAHSSESWGFLGLYALSVGDRSRAIILLTRQCDFIQRLSETQHPCGEELGMWRARLNEAKDSD